MKRGDAAGLLRQNHYLAVSERLVFMLLLERSHNDTCEIEAKYAPNSRVELSRWAGLSTRQVQRAVKHLETHGWVRLERGCGRGQKTRYRLMVRLPDTECACPKGDVVSPIRREPKGDTMSGKGRHDVRKRETSGSPLSQVDPGFDTRTAGTGGVGTPRPCDYCDSTDNQIFGAYRLCKTHAGALWKEPAA